MNRHNIGSNNSSWNNTSITDAYKEQITYDANGNIKTYKRNGNKAGSLALMDDLTYGHTADNSGRLVNNKLRHVKDAVNNGYITDIDNQADDNYSYDKIGNLTADKAESIQKINWTVYGKVAGIQKSNASISYDYDAGGNRINKKVADNNGSTATHYVRDAQGNVLGVYSYKGNSAGTLTEGAWREQNLYGSSRIGMLTPNLVITTPLASANYNGTNDHTEDEGKRLYELSNHLGNIMVTISDKKIGVDNNSDGIIDYYNADVVSAYDYYPGGMEMPGRTYISGSQYRYGFQKQEIDREFWGGAVSFEHRVEDPRLVRFFSVDPIASKYPYYSPYQFSGNRLIDMVELEGLEPAQSGSYGGQGAIAPKLDDKGKAIEGTDNQRWTWDKNQWGATNIGVTQNELTTVFRGGDKSLLKTLETTVNLEGSSYGIASQKELNGFIAQTGFETQGFKRLSENLNYSLSGLKAHFPSKVKGSSDEYLNSIRVDADKLAVFLYGGVGNGLDYRGRGAIHTTLQANYKTLSGTYNSMYGTSYDFTKTPAMLATDNLIGVRSGLIFFKVNGLFGMTNYDIDKVSKTVNRYDKQSFPSRNKLFQKVNGVIK